MLTLKYTVFTTNFIQEFSKLLNISSLNIATSIALSKSIDAIQTEHAIYDKQRIALIERLGVKIEKTDTQEPHVTMAGASDANIQEFNDKFKELCEVEFTLPLKTKIKLMGDVKLSPMQVYNLKDILDLEDAD